METRASNLVVGGFVVVLLIAAVGFIVWLSQVEVGAVLTRYYIYFTSDVSGLSVGSPVNYRGIRVGQVTDIRIDPDNIERVRVEIEVSDAAQIRMDAFAQLQMQGITGVGFIQITGGTEAAPPLEPEAGMTVAVIPSMPSDIQEFLTSAPELVSRLITVADRINDVINDDNRRAFASVLANVEQLSAQLTESSVRLDSFLHTIDRDAPGLIDHTDQAIIQFTDTVANLDAEVSMTLQSIRGTAESIAGAADQIRALVAENRIPIRDFTQSGLVELQLFLNEARSLVERLQRVAAEIERDPSQFIFGNPNEGVQLQ
jgi:phospholipid/cholesterol/gamma-HCH transport system substrate-binding protein